MPRGTYKRTDEHNRKIAEAIRRRHAEGKQPTPRRCPQCGAFIGEGHSGSEIMRKMREEILRNPTRYWLGKKRDEHTKQRLREAGGQIWRGTYREKHPAWKGGCSNYWHNEARTVMSKVVGRELAS